MTVRTKTSFTQSAQVLGLIYCANGDKHNSAIRNEEPLPSDTFAVPNNNKQLEFLLNLEFNHFHG